jgi:hypothetical protein
MACPLPDVRCPAPGRLGAKLGEKPKVPSFHPGVTGEGKTGRVNDVNPCLMPREALPRMVGCCGGV